MSRLSTLNSTAATNAHVPFALFTEFDFVSGTVRLVTWDQDISWGGNAFQSVGKLANVDDLQESTDLTSSDLTFTLSGVDSSLLATTLTEKYHNRNATAWLGYMDATNTLVDTPYLLWEGFMDSMQITSDEQKSSISLVCENRLLLLGKTAGWTYSDVHQKQFFAGDNFFNLVAALVNKIVNWGAPSTSTAT